MEYIISDDISGEVLSTNITNDLVKTELLKCSSNYERINCSIKKVIRKQGFLKVNTNNFYLSTYEEKITNRIFKHYLNAFTILAKVIDVNLTSIKEIEEKKTRRLKHNLINHNSNILQELYKLVPQDSFKNGSNHLEVIQKVIDNNSRKASFTYLKILKSSNLMKAEFDVYEMLDNENPYLDFYDHPIHKVLVLTLNPFWLDLVEKKVNIHIDPFYEKALIDYKSISVAFSHIFDNITKYILPHSELSILFKIDKEKVNIIMDMTSMKVEENEVLKIFSETISGKWSKETDTAGDGIGMFVVKKLIKLNNGDVKLVRNFDNSSEINYNGIPYEKNRIEIELNKSG